MQLETANYRKPAPSVAQPQISPNRISIVAPQTAQISPNRIAILPPPANPNRSLDVQRQVSPNRLPQSSVIPRQLSPNRVEVISKNDMSSSSKEGYNRQISNNRLPSVTNERENQISKNRISTPLTQGSHLPHLPTGPTAPTRIQSTEVVLPLPNNYFGVKEEGDYLMSRHSISPNRLSHLPTTPFKERVVHPPVEPLPVPKKIAKDAAIEGSKADDLLYLLSQIEYEEVPAQHVDSPDAQKPPKLRDLGSIQLHQAAPPTQPLLISHSQDPIQQPSVIPETLTTTETTTTTTTTKTITIQSPSPN